MAAEGGSFTKDTSWCQIDLISYIWEAVISDHGNDEKDDSDCDGNEDDNDDVLGQLTSGIDAHW